MIYLDTSALNKFLVAELESDVLTAWIAAQADTDPGFTSSDVGRIEICRVGARLGGDEDQEHARFLSDWLHGIAVTEAIVTAAQVIGPPHLRSLDAIHLASAVSIRDELRAFVSYDKRLLEAARAEGLTVVSPGAQA